MRIVTAVTSSRRATRRKHSTRGRPASTSAWNVRNSWTSARFGGCDARIRSSAASNPKPASASVANNSSVTGRSRSTWATRRRRSCGARPAAGARRCSTSQHPRDAYRARAAPMLLSPPGMTEIAWSAQASRPETQIGVGDRRRRPRTTRPAMRQESRPRRRAPITGQPEPAGQAIRRAGRVERRKVIVGSRFEQPALRRDAGPRSGRPPPR